MRETKPIILLVSIAALALGLQQSAMAEAPPATTPEPQTALEAAAATPTAPTTPEVKVEVETTSGPTDQETVGAPQATPALPAAQAADTASHLEAARKRMEAAHKRMDERQAEMMAERERRYEELRDRAAQTGLELPETPPWSQAQMTPPAMPAPPRMPALPHASDDATATEARDAMREERYQAMRERAAQQGVDLPEIPPWKLMSREERQANRKAMRNLSTEERNAVREKHWQMMRERAAERGVEMPETPPWRQMEQQREAMRAKQEGYRKIIEDMSEEQRDAAAAVFGRPTTPPPVPRQRMQRPYPNYGSPRMQPQLPRRQMMPRDGFQPPRGPWSGGTGARRPGAGHYQGW